MTKILKFITNLKNQLAQSNEEAVRRAVKSYSSNRNSLNVEVVETKSGVQIKLNNPAKARHKLAKSLN